MAGTAAAGEVWQVKIHGRQEGQECLNVLHFKTELGDNDVTTHLLTVLVTCIVTSLLPGLSTSYFLERVTGMRVSPTVGPEFEVTPDPEEAVQGAQSGDWLPTLDSCVVSILSERGGRSGKGRFFLAGIPEGSTTGSFISPESPYWGAVVAFVTCLVTNFIHTGEFPVANQWYIGVMSRKIGGEKPPFTVNGFAPALSFRPQPLIATTRSRKVGKGS